MYSQRQRGVIDTNMYNIVARNRGYSAPLIALNQSGHGGAVIGSTPLSGRAGMPYPRPSSVILNFMNVFSSLNF